jgi:hypothetical protein
MLDDGAGDRSPQLRNHDARLADIVEFTVPLVDLQGTEVKYKIIVDLRLSTIPINSDTKRTEVMDKASSHYEHVSPPVLG